MAFYYFHETKKKKKALNGDSAIIMVIIFFTIYITFIYFPSGFHIAKTNKQTKTSDNICINTVLS